MPTPKPPPAKRCTRYSAQGEPCTKTTARLDAWCGTCDGFTRPMPPKNPAAAEDEPSSGKPRRENEAPPDIAPEDLAYIEVSRTATDSFLAIHGGTTQSARQQILSLLEDCLNQKNPDVRRTGNGFVKLRLKGFSVVLSPELDLVTAYGTNHRERTWAQVKAGVKSRASKLAGEVTRELGGEELPFGLVVDPDAVSAYAWRNDLPRINFRERRTASIAEAVVALREAAQLWDGTSELLPDPARANRFWVIRKDDERDGRHLIVTYLGPGPALHERTGKPEHLA